MAKYRVIKYFTDLQDNNYAYHVGDKYPREGIDPKPSRVAELAGSNNKRGVPLIELVKESTPKSKTVEDEAKSEDITEAETVEVEAEEKPKTKAKRNTKSKE